VLHAAAHVLHQQQPSNPAQGMQGSTWQQRQLLLLCCFHSSAVQIHPFDVVLHGMRSGLISAWAVVLWGTRVLALIISGCSCSALCVCLWTFFCCFCCLVQCIGYNDRCILLDPNLAEAHANLANALQQMGNVDMAIVYYQSALRLKPYFTDAYNNMASALVQKGLIPEAMDCYMQVRVCLLTQGRLRGGGGIGRGG
jgi:hypothetical protein